MHKNAHLCILATDFISDTICEHPVNHRKHDVNAWGSCQRMGSSVSTRFNTSSRREWSQSSDYLVFVFYEFELIIKLFKIELGQRVPTPSPSQTSLPSQLYCRDQRGESHRAL